MPNRKDLAAVAAMMGIIMPNPFDTPIIHRAFYPRTAEHAAELVKKLRAFHAARQWHQRARRKKIDLPAHQRFIYRRAEKSLLNP